jgi:hypothetical protein
VRLEKPTKFPAIGFLFVLAASVLLGACSHRGQFALAITHVTLIDATGSAPQPDMTVLIADHRIASIGPAKMTRVLHDTQVFDGTGKFLIPGLADMHVHLTGSGEPAGSREFIVPLLVANGITTVRDMGSYLESLIPLRHDIEEGKRLGPQMFFAGPYLDGSPPSFQPSLVVTSSVEAAEDVHQLVGRGVDFIKVQSVLSRDAYFAVARACHQEHISFVGHVPDAVTATEASDAGQKSIEHLTGVLRACTKDEAHLMREQLRNGGRKETPARARTRELSVERELLQTYSGTKATELMEKFVRNQTWQVPTLILLRNLAYATPQIDRSDNPAAKYVPHKLLEQWLAVRHKQNAGGTSQEFAVRAALLQRSIELVGTMQASGVQIMAGTDTGAPYVFPGFALHDELALLVQAGLTPMQVLQAATRNPADFLGKTNTQGTVQQGKGADLLLLDANPLDDIHNTKKIRAVILRGKLLDRNELDALLAAEEKFAGSN